MQRPAETRRAVSISGNLSLLHPKNFAVHLLRETDEKGLPNPGGRCPEVAGRAEKRGEENLIVGPIG